MNEFGDAIRDATQGRAGSDALTAAAQALRAYVKDHPCRYTAGNSARPTGSDDPLIPASNRLLASLSAVLSGYHVDPNKRSTPSERSAACCTDSPYWKQPAVFRSTPTSTRVSLG